MTHNTPAPEPPRFEDALEADPAHPRKAYAAAAVTLVGTVLAYWIGDEDPFTRKEFGAAVLAGVVASGLTGGATFAVRNPIRVARRR